MADAEIDHPQHYTFGGVEVFDAIEAWELNFARGNAVKYVARAGRKADARELDDLKKARWYLDREIARLEAQTQTPSTCHWLGDEPTEES